jgi:hypothetical protein
MVTAATGKAREAQAICLTPHGFSKLTGTLSMPAGIDRTDLAGGKKPAEQRFDPSDLLNNR